MIRWQHDSIIFGSYIIRKSFSCHQRVFHFRFLFQIYSSNNIVRRHGSTILFAQKEIYFLLSNVFQSIPCYIFHFDPISHLVEVKEAGSGAPVSHNTFNALRLSSFVFLCLQRPVVCDMILILMKIIFRLMEINSMFGIYELKFVIF